MLLVTELGRTKKPNKDHQEINRTQGKHQNGGQVYKKKILNVSRKKGNTAQNNSELAFLTRKISIIY